MNMVNKMSLSGLVIELAAQIQRIPAPTFDEHLRADFILHKWQALGVKEAWRDEVGNVYARLPGLKNLPSLVISAHLDTVFPVDTDISLRRTHDRIYGPGIGDNSLGLAGLFGCYWSLTGSARMRKKLPALQGDVWFVANVAEEGLGDLKGMKAVVDYFGADPQAYLVLEGMSLGQIYHQGLGVRRYRITVHTGGGHSWIDYGNPSAIHQLAELIVKINHIPIPREPRTSINVGMVKGGTSVNTIAALASCELDLRSEDSQSLEAVIERVLALISEADQMGAVGVHVEAEIIGDRPTGAIPPDHQLVEIASDCYKKKGLQPCLTIGSTDANVPLSRGLPAICIGLTTGGGAHTLGEYIDTAPLAQGLNALVDIVRAIDKDGISKG
jgi:tripeptide aminopeptidase